MSVYCRVQNTSLEISLSLSLSRRQPSTILLRIDGMNTNNTQELTSFESIVPKCGWYTITSHKSFDNFGLSRPIEYGKILFRYVVCVDCGAGPLGYVDGADFENKHVYLVKDRVVLGVDKEDADEGRVDDALMAQVREMMKKGKGTTEFSVKFSEVRLGMMLQDHPDKSLGGGVVVGSFTTNERGEIGVAEKGGEIRVGDVVIGVNQTNTRTMNYAQVLDLIVGKPRPIELHFEREGTSIPEEDSSTTKRRVMHVDWNGCRDAAEEDEVVTTKNSTSD